MKVKARTDNILCTDGDFGDQVTQSGIIIQKTIGKSEGIVPRWFRVFEVGPDVDWVEPGQWVLVEYGRWTEAMDVHDERFSTEGNIGKLWKVEPKSCMAVSDEKPETLNLTDSTVTAQKLTR
jgi:hypothetical protein